MNGTDASTTFTDSSSYSKTITAEGNAQIDTAQSKFGGASGLFDGTGDRLTIPDSADWDFGTGDFTIDFWVRFNSLGVGVVRFFEFGDVDSAKGIAMRLDGGVLYIAHNGGSPFSYSWSPSTATWYHVAITRASNTERVFIDGTQIGSDQTVSTNIDAGTAGGFIGAWGGASYTSYWLNGWLDEFRVVKGTAVWTANFTPPSAEYSLPSSSKKFALLGVG